MSTSIGYHTSFNNSVSNVNAVSLSTGVYTVIAGNLGINLGGCKAARLCKLGSRGGGFRVVVMGNMGSIHTMT